VSLTIKPINLQGQSEVVVEAELTMTVAELKEVVGQKFSMPKENIRLVCAGRVWADQSTVGFYEPKANAMVHCLNNPPRTAAAAPAAAADPASQVLAPANPLAMQMPPMMPPFGAPGAQGGGMDQMFRQQADMMMQNPEMMRQIMESPMMQQMMSDPETMRGIFRMNPQLNDLLERNPQMARMLEDPELMQQAMRAATNPSLMREMMRQQDQAMGRLDVMPGGHAALSQLHNEFIDPLHNAMHGSAGGAATGPSEANVAAYANQAAGGPSADAMPNPFGGSTAPPPAPTMPSPAPVPAAGYPTPAAVAPASATPGTAPAAPTAQQVQAAQANAVGNLMGNPDQMQNMMNMMQANPQMMEQATRMMSDPAMMAQVQQMMQNPAILGAMSPQAQQMMQNPMMMQQMQQMMQNPQAMQQMMQFAGAMGGGGGGMGGQNANPFAAQMAQQMGAALPPPAAGGTETTEPAAPGPMDRMRFAMQLQQLAAMGFADEEVCLAALARAQGNVDRALDILFAQ